MQVGVAHEYTRYPDIRAVLLQSLHVVQRKCVLYLALRYVSTIFTSSLAAVVVLVIRLSWFSLLPLLVVLQAILFLVLVLAITLLDGADTPYESTGQRCWNAFRSDDCCFEVEDVSKVGAGRSLELGKSTSNSQFSMFDDCGDCHRIVIRSCMKLVHLSLSLIDCKSCLTYSAIELCWVSFSGWGRALD